MNVLQQKLTDAKVKFTTKDKKPTLFTLARDNGLLDEDVDKENATPVVNAVVVASHSSNSSSTASNSSDANKRDSNNSYSSVDSTSTASNSSYANKRDSNNSYSSGDSTAVASNSSGELPNERHPHSSNSSSTASDSSDANKRDSNHSNSSGDSTSTASNSSDANTRVSNRSNSSGDSTSTASNSSSDSTSAASNSSGELPYLAQLFNTRNRLRAEKRENTMLRAKEEIESDRQLLDCNRKFLGSFDKDGNWEMGKVEKRLRECWAKATNEHSRSRLRDELFKVRDLVMNHRVALKRESWTQSSRFSPTIQVRVLQTIMRK